MSCSERTDDTRAGDQRLFLQSIVGILPPLGVLAVYAAVLLTLAAWRLRRVLST
jgi:hypothetical protein